MHDDENSSQPQPQINMINMPDIQNVMSTSQASGHVISLDPGLFQSQGILPISLSLADNMGQIQESTLAAHVLQGLENVQLQLTNNVGQGGIQITGLDPSIFSQTVQIDASLLQQLQQQGNVNITINPSVLTQGMQVADPNLVQGLQVKCHTYCGIIFFWGGGFSWNFEILLVCWAIISWVLTGFLLHYNVRYICWDVNAWVKEIHEITIDLL